MVMAAHPIEIAPGVHSFRILIANVYFVRTGAGWVLIDTAIPNRGEAIRAAAESVYGPGSKPNAILLTHGHLDHSGSAVELARKWSVPVYLGRAEFPFVEGEITYPAPDPAVGGFMAFVSRLFPVAKIDLEDVPEPLENGTSTMPDWQFIPAPGHAPGQFAFFRPSDRTLIAGDACATVNLDSFAGVIANRQQISRPPAPFTCDWNEARRSIQTLAGLNPQVLACGHGTPMTGPGTAQKFQEFARNFQLPSHARYVSHPYRAA